MDSDEQVSQELDRLFALPEKELYGLLVPECSAFNEQGRINAGKEVLQRILSQCREKVCMTYRANKSAVRDSADLAKLLTDSLQVGIAIAGLKVPVIPVAVLLVKIGLEKLCPAVAA